VDEPISRLRGTGSVNFRWLQGLSLAISAHEIATAGVNSLLDVPSFVFGRGLVNDFVIVCRGELLIMTWAVWRFAQFF